MTEPLTHSDIAALALEKRRAFAAANGCEAEAILLGPAEYLAWAQGGGNLLCGLPVRVDARYSVAAWGHIRRWRGRM